LEIHLLSLCPMKGLFVKICTERALHPCGGIRFP
jgi:hypothetical protein